MGQKRRPGNASILTKDTFPDGTGLFATFAGLLAANTWSALGKRMSPGKVAQHIEMPSRIIEGLRKGFTEGRAGCSMDEARKAIGEESFFFSGPIILHSSFHNAPRSVVLGGNHQEAELFCRWLGFVPWSAATLESVRETHALIAVPTYSVRWLAYMFPDVLPDAGQAVLTDDSLDQHGVLPRWWLVRKFPSLATLGKTYHQQRQVIPEGEQEVGLRELVWMVREVQRSNQGNEVGGTLKLNLVEVRCPEESATKRGSGEKLRVTVSRERSGGAIRFHYLGENESRPDVGMLTALQPEFPHPMDHYR